MTVCITLTVSCLLFIACLVLINT